MLAFDHLTVAALSLDEGISYVESALGVRIPQGGAHPVMGTHNHLMQLGAGRFLEVIAPDTAVRPERPRWFGLDIVDIQTKLRVSPQIVTWVVRVSDIAAIIAALGSLNVEAVRVSRGSLSWLISVAPDGSMPFDGAFPTMIEWPAGPHPSISMADLGYRLEQLAVTHPSAYEINAKLERLGFNDGIVKLSAGPLSFKATFQTPNGIRTLV